MVHIEVNYYSKILGDGGPGVSRETVCPRELRLVHMRKLLGISRTDTKERTANKKIKNPKTPP